MGCRLHPGVNPPANCSLRHCTRLGRPAYAIPPMAVAQYRGRHSVARKKPDHIEVLTLANILRTDARAHRRLPAIATSRGRPRCSLALLRMQSGGLPGPIKNYKPGRSGHEGIEVSRSVRVQRNPAGLSAYRPPILMTPPSCRRWLPRSPPSVRGGDRGAETRQASRRQGLALLRPPLAAR